MGGIAIEDMQDAKAASLALLGIRMGIRLSTGVKREWPRHRCPAGYFSPRLIDTYAQSRRKGYTHPYTKISVLWILQVKVEHERSHLEP